ncbi:MAG: ATP-binding protein [Cyclobacteriaceae bacterium]
MIHILNDEEEFALDQNGIIIGSNLEAVNVTGYEEFEIIGKPISIFYPPDENEKANADLEKARRLGNTIVSGLRVKKRGVNFWAKMKIRFIESAPGNPSYNVVLQDATHRAISKERIRTLRDEYLAIFNNPFVGTFKFRMDNYLIQMCNQKTLDIFNEKESNQLQLNNFFAAQNEFETFISLLRSEKKLEGFKFLIQDGRAPQENWGLISARFYESQGFAEGVLFDITEQHRQMVELQRVNTELDNFTYHASHDLRSPLTSIMGLVNLGLNETSMEGIHKYLKMIRGRIGHLDLLLKDLISVSYNSGTNLTPELFYFEREVDSILKLLENPIVSFKVTVNISQEVDFKTDAVRMRTILRNLISNAMKYYNPTQSDPFIQINIRVSSTHCAIQLRDNGIGIHPDLKGKVYEMFFRATDRSSGSGLGLYIVKSMVDKLDGRISFDSTLNVGTTFLLTIPNQMPFVQSANDQNNFMLTTKQTELVESSWDYVLLNSHEAGAVFYKRLFALDPSLRQLFKGDIQLQSQKLVAMVTFAVHKLSHLDEIIADIKALGVAHHKKYVMPEHYPIVASALLWTLEKSLGNHWNDEIRDAWTHVYNMLAKVMIEAGEEI